jgi:hypothetical protein
VQEIKRRCGDCRYSQLVHVSVDVKARECRRFPPIPHERSPGALYAPVSHPFVADYHWCYEFASREVSDPVEAAERALESRGIPT